MSITADPQIKRDIIRSLDILPTKDLLDVRHFLAKLIGTQLSDSVTAKWEKGEMTPESIQKAKQTHRKS